MPSSKEYMTAYRAKNAEKIASQAKAHKSEPETREAISTQQHNKRVNDVQRFLLKGARQRAREKGYPCTIVKEDIVVPEICPYLGLTLFVSKGRATDNSPALDKIIPELGYVPGNVQVISHLANMMKSHASLEQVLTFSDSVYRIHGG